MTDFTIKFDQGKPKAGLVLGGFAEALLEVSKVGTDGAEVHGANTWQRVEIERYKDAICRHLLQYLGGEYHDNESGSPAMAHVAWNALAILQLEQRKRKNENNTSNKSITQE